MAYATPSEIREALAPDGDTSSATAASLDDSQLIDAIDEATAEIDARVPGAPFDDPAPALVASITRDVAAYLATLTYRKGNPLAPEHPVALRYTRAQALLASAQAGKLDLSGEPESVSSEVAIANPYEGDLFTLEDAGIGEATRILPPWLGGQGWP